MAQAPVQQLDPSSLKEQIQMFLSCQDLISRDLLSKTDPFVVVYMKTQKTGKFEEIGRTETIKDSHYPKFAKEFVLDYFFEEEQELRFDVYDEDKKDSKNLKDHDFVGSCLMVLGELVHAPGQQMVKQLLAKGKSIKNGKTKMYARLTARVELVGKGTQEDLTMTFAGEKLAKMDFFGKSDPFLEIYRFSKDQPILVHKTEVIKNTDKPTWKPFTISSQKLCNSDAERPLLLRVWDWDSDGSQQLIGEVKTNLNYLRKDFKAELENPQKKGKKVGTLKVAEFKSTMAYTFLNYMAGGVDLSLMVAIDFTGSNGHPSKPQSLHYLAPQGSQYQQAIRTIGNIVSCYDSDQKFPVWGFGAKLPDGTVTHDFALNGKEDDPEVSGIHGIEEVYVRTIQHVELYGPTFFQSILQKAIAIADSAHSNVKKKLQYFTLLILTDGVINDFKETKDLIVLAANRYLPLSIIIVGVGMADFSQMQSLDADGGSLMNSKGEVAKRDIVQFVSLREYSKPLKDQLGQVIGFSETRFAELSKETLKEIPEQFMSYVKFHHLAPAKPTVAKNVDSQFAVSETDLLKSETLIDGLGTKPTNMFQFQQGAEPPLPPGWQKTYDTDGTPYYINHVDKKTQWEHPATRKVSSTTTTQQSTVTQTPLVQQQTLTQTPLIQQQTLTQTPLVQQQTLTQTPLIQQQTLTQTPLIQQQTLTQQPLFQQQQYIQQPLMQQQLVNNSGFVSQPMMGYPTYYQQMPLQQQQIPLQQQQIPLQQQQIPLQQQSGGYIMGYPQQMMYQQPIQSPYLVQQTQQTQQQQQQTQQQTQQTQNSQSQWTSF